MNKLLPELILYNTIKDDDVIAHIAQVYELIGAFSYREINEQRNVIIEHINSAISYMSAVAERFSLKGDIWRHYLTLLIMGDENPFSLCAERRKVNKTSTVYKMALKDMRVFMQLFDFDFLKIEQTLSIEQFSGIKNYRPCISKDDDESKDGEKIMALSDAIYSAKDTKDMLTEVCDYYAEFGVGSFGLYRAFRISDTDSRLNLKHVSIDKEITLDDLVGYDIQKKQLRDNTKAFVSGKKANDVLLYGDNGTGKSTSIKAILNEYASSGLRLIEVNKYQFRLIPVLISEIKNRNYKFIIFIDDLSFEEDEIEFKFLKSVIEGGIETRPDNILIYATSNRRHLIKEIWDDRKDMEHDGDIHHSDTMEEKISLSSRFGMTINFSKPDKKGYEEIVKALAKKEKIKIDEKTLLKEAEKWEIRHGGFTGRVAQQFINHISGMYR